MESDSAKCKIAQLCHVWDYTTMLCQINIFVPENSIVSCQVNSFVPDYLIVPTASYNADNAVICGVLLSTGRHFISRATGPLYSSSIDSNPFTVSSFGAIPRSAIFPLVNFFCRSVARLELTWRFIDRVQICTLSIKKSATTNTVLETALSNQMREIKTDKICRRLPLASLFGAYW